MGESRGDRIMSGTVISLMIRKEKRGAFCQTERMALDAGKGIRGDCHYASGRKQVCLLDEKCRRWIEEQDREGLCLPRFQENILIGGTGPDEWKRGNRIRIGEVLLEIKQTGKKCFPECSRVQAGKPCLLKKSCCFAAVLEGGRISAGDAVSILKTETYVYETGKR